MEDEIYRLNLISPLFYEHDGESEPFNNREGNEGSPSKAREGEEKLFCFELDEALYRIFEPDKNRLMENLIFSGKDAMKAAIKAAGNVSARAGGKTPLELPSGNYFFAQKREILSKEAIIDLALEIQQELLWQRFLPGKKLYLRYLFEDGCWVTQLFRPYK